MNSNIPNSENAVLYGLNGYWELNQEIHASSN
jgi:hypothetical protein